MTIGTNWVAHHGGFAEGIEVWAVATQEDDFMPNVNVLTQAIGDMTLEDYSALSLRNAPLLIADFRLLESRTARGPDGSLLAVLDFTGTGVGRRLHFLAVWTVRDGRAIVATLTTPVGSFDRIRATIEPYLLTLAAS
ncbi:MAG TPA: hypothetical protein VGQ58_06395 [Candidatus Limnocylindrales bacterium]|nr:hypothetical protein [Candidatus Limnocylindrales bacterium]